MNMKVLDFPYFLLFNYELFHIAAQLRLCGKPLTEAQLIDKILSTFPPASMLISTQHKNMKFK